MTTSEFVQNIRNLVADGKTEEALNEFQKAAPTFAPNLMSELTLLEAQYNNARKDYLTNGILSREEYDRTVARITYALLELLEPLEKSALAPLPTTPTPTRGNTGKLLHSIPGVMPLAKETRCIVRVAYDEVVLMQDFKKTADTVIQDVRITEVMNVELCDYNEAAAFNIRNITDNEQSTDTVFFTEWLFLVKPLREGTYPLTLKVTVIETVNGKDRHRNVVLEKQVFVLNTASAAVATAPTEAPRAAEAKTVLWEDTAVRLNYTITDAEEPAMMPAPSSPTVAPPRRTIASILTAAATIVMAIVGYRVILPSMSSAPTPPTTAENNGDPQAGEKGRADTVSLRDLRAQDTLENKEMMAQVDTALKGNIVDEPKIYAAPKPPVFTDAQRKDQEERKRMAQILKKRQQKEKESQIAARNARKKAQKDPTKPPIDYNPNEQDERNNQVNGNKSPEKQPAAEKPKDTPRSMAKVAITGLTSEDRDVEIVVDGKVIQPIRTKGGGLFSSEYTKIIELPAGMTHRVTFRNKQGGCTIEVTTKEGGEAVQKLKACQFRDVKKSDE